METLTREDVPAQTRDYFDKGLVALERGNLDYAVDLLFSCVSTCPDFLQARKFLRAAEVRMLRKKKAGPAFHAISLVVNMPTYIRALTLKRSKKMDQALLAGEQLLRKDPLNLKFVRLFAEIAAQAGMPEAAIQTLEVAREHYPENVLVIKWLGELYLKVGRSRSARECFEKLCEIVPNDPTAAKALKDATALDSMGGWEAAAAAGDDYRSVIRDTKKASLIEQEAKAVKTDRDVDALLLDVMAKIKEEPENINYYRQLARLYVQKKEFEEAVATIEKARQMSPGDPELDAFYTATQAHWFDHRITVLQEKGDQAAADKLAHERAQFLFDDIQERVRRYPNDLKLKFELGRMLYDNDYTDEAIQQFQQAQRSPKHRTMALYYMAMCFKRKRQYDMAMEQLEKASSEMPLMDENKKNVLYELGSVAEAMGDFARAADFYKEIYQYDIGFRDVSKKVEELYKG